MTMKRLLFILLLATAFPAFAQTVEVKDGNIQFTDKSGKTTALTSSGRDSDPLLAPDGKWVVFVRKIDGEKIATGSAEESDPCELWQVRVDGKEPTMLLRTGESKGDKDHPLAGFLSLQFSTNGKLVYFTSPQWAVSNAVHVVDTMNRKEHYLFPGNEVKVVTGGEYKDCLLVQQHRYFIGGGAYDWYWLLRPDGKEVGPVGEDISNFEASYGNE
jgi:WD40-like Beta Propeller Repeat